MESFCDKLLVAKATKLAAPIKTVLKLVAKVVSKCENGGLTTCFGSLKPAGLTTSNHWCTYYRKLQPLVFSPNYFLGLLLEMNRCGQTYRNGQFTGQSTLKNEDDLYKKKQFEGAMY